MSDPSPSSEIAGLPRPDPPRSWRERLAEWAEALDMTPGRLLVGVVAVVVVAVGGWKLLAPPPPPPEMRIPFASSTTAAAVGSTSLSVEEVVVHVAGAVNAPGVQRLPTGTRVVDAVQAAGNVRPDADVARVNLAAPLEDGQQIYVPAMGEAPLLPPPISPGASGGDAGPVDLNAATEADLDALPGIGPAIAAAIVDHRDRNGPFTSVDELLDVRGIGESKLEELRPLVTV